MLGTMAYITSARRLLRVLAAFFAAFSCAVVSFAAPVNFIVNGAPLNVHTDSGAWSSSGGYYRSSNPTAMLSLGDIITTGDFTLELLLRGQNFSSNPGSVFINGLGEFGFVRTNSNSPMFVRGFFFGDMTANIDHRNDFFSDGDVFRFLIVRAGDDVTISINGSPARSIEYESNRVFGKVSIRSNSGNLWVKSARLLAGSSAPLSAWVNPRTEVHPMPGEQVDVFSRGSGGYHTYRIPAVELTRTGVLMAFCEGRKYSGSDSGKIDLLLKRSFDGGRTWGPQQVIHSESGDTTIGNPVPVHDRRTNITWLAFCRNNDQVFITKTHDGGATWDAPREITSSVKKDDWNWYATGPGHGLITSTGRIVIPANHGSRSHVFFSDDNGITWQLGGTMPGYGNEVTVAETSDGRLYMNSRNQRLAYFRLASYSNDLGQTWSTPKLDFELPEPTCQGSVRSMLDSDEHLLLFSNPASQRRERVTIRVSADDGQNWSDGMRIYEGSSAYSDVVSLGGGMVGCLYERDWYDHITFARVSLDDLRPSRIENWMDQEVAPHGN